MWDRPHSRCRLYLLIFFASASSACSRGPSPSFGRLQSALKTTQQIEAAVATLSDATYLVWPNFFESSQDTTELCSDLEDRFEKGELKQAGVKGPSSFSSVAQDRRAVLPAIRMTSTCWLDMISPKTEIESQVLLYLDVLRMQLGAAMLCEFECLDTEVLFARYPAGGYYKRHSDSHTLTAGAGVSSLDTERTLSFILYLNQSPWTPADGGQLRLYGHTGKDWDEFIDVPPTPGTLVLFKSRDFEHEVIETTVTRRALVGWFRVRTLPVPTLPPLFANI